MCVPCSENCASCSGHNKDDCLTCKPTFKLNTAGECVAKCADDEYEEKCPVTNI